MLYVYRNDKILAVTLRLTALYFGEFYQGCNDFVVEIYRHPSAGVLKNSSSEKFHETCRKKVTVEYSLIKLQS